MADIERYLINVNLVASVTDAAIASGEAQIGAQLPAEYLEFLKLTNGCEGFVGKEYVILWRIDELASMNQSYEVQKYVPGLLIFGSNGGGEAYGFDTRTPRWPIVRVPFVGMGWGLAEPMGLSFSQFLAGLEGTVQMKEPIPQRTLFGVDARGKEIFEIKPVILGGSPTDPANKTLLTRDIHIKAVVYWNKLIKDLRDQRKNK